MITIKDHQNYYYYDNNIIYINYNIYTYTIYIKLICSNNGIYNVSMWINSCMFIQLL